MTEPRDTMNPNVEPAPVPQAPPQGAMPAGPDTAVPPVARAATRRRRSGPEQVRRIMLFGFGLVEVLILLRIVLILVDARRDNAIVDAILETSEILVAPFQGILQSNVIQANGLVIDLAALVALIGWGILEFMLYWAIGLFRRETA